MESIFHWNHILSRKILSGKKGQTYKSEAHLMNSMNRLKSFQSGLQANSSWLQIYMALKNYDWKDTVGRDNDSGESVSLLPLRSNQRGKAWDEYLIKKETVAH